MDLAGLAPGVGEPIDGFNAVISMLRGKYGDAALSAGAMVPVLGMEATALKFGKNAARFSKINRSVTVRALADQIRPMTKKETRAAAAAADEYRKVLKETGDKQLAASRAGSKYHARIGAAGPQQGVDLHKPGWQKEVKTHYGPMEQWHIHAAERQSFSYSQQHQAQTRGLVPIRLVEHVYIDPRTGQAAKFLY
jgi:hypothetical protein